jgi:urea transport system permease protein
MFCMAALFIGVTMFFPNGLAGLYVEKLKPWLASRRTPKTASTPPARTPGAANAAATPADASTHAA